MEKRIKEFIEQNNLILDKPIVCAVSGGADSVCLLNSLHSLGYSVILAHVNHNKRKESIVEEKAMRDLAEKMAIPFELLDYHYSGLDNFHNDSHHARYTFFRNVCKKYNTNIIATAHHMDDQLETVLIKLMEGSNLYGYGGISIENNDNEYRIVRPLLCLSKEDIYKYCQLHSIEYFEDSSNHEDAFLRNRLRHHVVPILKKECPSVLEKTMEYSIQAHEAFSFIREQSILYLKEHKNEIQIESFKSLHIALRHDIIALLLEQYEIRKNKEIIQQIEGILSSNLGNKCIYLEDGYRFYRSYNRAYISKEKIVDTKEVYLYENEYVIYDKYRFFLSKNINNTCTKYIKLCYNVLEFPLVIRSRREGDDILLKAGTKKVSRVFIDQKIPKEERDHIPLIFNGNGELLWIYDVMKSEAIRSFKENGDIYLMCEGIENDER